MRDASAAPRPTRDHLGAPEMAAFVDGRLIGARRREVVRHLATCAACRAEVAEVRALLDASPGAPARRGWVGAALGAAAAAVLLFVLPLGRPGTDQTPSPSQRAAADSRVAIDGDAPAVRLAAPAADAMVEGAVRFSWRPSAPDATYAMSIQDSTGTVVWNVATRDTALALPRDVQLTAGASYFWSVESQGGDGRSARSAVRRVTVR